MKLNPAQRAWLRRRRALKRKPRRGRGRPMTDEYVEAIERLVATSRNGHEVFYIRARPRRLVSMRSNLGHALARRGYQFHSALRSPNTLVAWAERL